MTRPVPKKETILISGSRKGIGRFLSEYYLKKGKTVIGCSRSNSDLKHKRYHHFCVDITQEKEVLQLFSQIRKLGLSPDVLLNNAGIGSLNLALLTPMQTAQNIMDTNLMGTFLLSREAAKMMMKKNYGRIVNFTSGAVPLKLKGEAIYAASKAAVVQLTQILAKEFGPLGITVNVIGPAPIETDLIKNLPKNKLDKMLEQQSVKRFATVNDLIYTLDYFCSPQADFVSGQVIYLGGIS